MAHYSPTANEWYGLTELNKSECRLWALLYNMGLRSKWSTNYYAKQFESLIKWFIQSNLRWLLGFFNQNCYEVMVVCIWRLSIWEANQKRWEAQTFPLAVVTMSCNKETLILNQHANIRFVHALSKLQYHYLFQMP